uniref:Alpha 1,4-glycosyltransferase domain-containing protein n=2 Tax=Aureoumbra lagunensis TaxID=44058 RepID=A0A7S3K346_9STRA|mmetsp:Transcript_3274/g.4540  ORF Transcript_3274/g.4540 Transcript_3274/m.4540 type:complete len:260 (+) Transcript_3274:142-921(+)
MIKDYENEAKISGIQIEIQIYNFTSAHKLVKSIDADLGLYFYQMNIMYATTLSNIFRLAALWKFGGIYHDIKCSLESKNLKMIHNSLQIYDLVFEERPGSFGHGARRIRATNMAAARPKLNYFLHCLSIMRKKLNAAYEKQKLEEKNINFNIKKINVDRHLIYDIGSHSMLDYVAAHTHLPHSGHVTIGFHCNFPHQTHKFCSDDPITGLLPGNESFVIYLWRTHFDTGILHHYNKGSSQHWSHISQPLFTSPIRVLHL